MARIDMAALHKKIEKSASPLQAEIKKQRKHLLPILKTTETQKRHTGTFLTTGIPGFDDLFEHGIPKGNTVIIAGGTGSGKTIFCLQTLINHARKGEKCLYMSFEESETRLIKHMEDFGWDPQPLIKKGTLLVRRFNPFEITRSVDALLLKAKGELLIDIEPIIFPDGFIPEVIVLDSLTAIASAFTDKEDSYRIYIEQLFRFFEQLNATAFLVTETEQVPKIFSASGVEEFLADGVIVLYAIKHGNTRENAVEVLKMRGEKHQKKIVAMQISDKGITVYPEQEVFNSVEKNDA
ncbi:AAA family ATPase [Candidatus Woesearchaeota archaeon]|nr:AAA family ATPase [Candidatus Woesearchaeota archaeon]